MKNTKQTIAITAKEIEDATLHGKTADYKETGIRVALRVFETKKGRSSSYQITVPAKLTGQKDKRKGCKTATEAVRWIEAWLKSHTTGEAYKDEQRAFESCVMEMRELGVSVPELLTHYKETFVKPEDRLTLREIHEDLLKILERRDLSEKQMKSIKGYGNRIVKDFENCEVHTITAKQAYEWATSAETGELPWSGKTRQHHWNWLDRMMRRAVSKGAIHGNPLDKLGEEELADITRHKAAPPMILTPKETKQLLATIREKTPELLASTVLQLFAGLRTEEARRIEWRDVNLEDGLVHVVEGVAKTNDIRNVEINDTCKAWLKAVPHVSDKVCPMTPKEAENYWRNVSGNLPYRWKHNAARHSFASYTLVSRDKSEDAEAYTKAQLGHSQSSRTLFKHYRHAATRKTAKSYFDILPDMKGSDILSFESKRAAS